MIIQVSIVSNVGRSEITPSGLLLTDTVPDDSTTCAVVIFRARVELYKVS